ncbi:C40 family peptidase [Mumia sp. zg.B21]|uniref:C40 family peptidase n=1 Tax=Mumia sp. zg.B21 TaxID=2855447 RepID=UPI001C6E50C4|nr:C40 family peptidase [Mumia sp. zg.B21]MBW9209553.1 C40 family peptidase [Mumia sp. zg.B21]
MGLGHEGRAVSPRRLRWRRTAPLLAAGALTLTGVSAVHADEVPSAEAVAQAQQNVVAKGDQVAAIRSRIAAATKRVDDLAVRAAEAAEKDNGAQYALRKAEHAAKAAQAAARTAATAAEQERLAVERQAVGGIAARAPYNRLRSFFSDDGPSSLLHQLAAYDSVGDASRAALATYESKQAVAIALKRRADVAVAARETAADAARAAKQEAQKAVAAAAAARASLQRDRDQLIRELAHAEGISVTVASKRQRALEKLAQAAQEQANRPPAAAPSLPPTVDEPPAAVPAPAPGPAPAPQPGATPPKRAKGVEAAVQFALAQVGEPYVWAGAGPNAWDCSGLTMRAWQAAGKSLPHFSGAQYASSTPIALSDARRGDLLFWSRGGPDSIHHVALYLGDGWMVEAPRPGKSVQVVSVYSWTGPDLAARIR